MIPESFIQEVLNRTDVVDVIDKRVQLKKAGANFVACCPFHQEKSPSFSVSPSKQFYHCFGCGAHGSAITFLIEFEGLTFVEAVHQIASSLGLTVPNEHIADPKKIKENFGLEEAMKIANQFYQKALRASPKAIEYLKTRGLTGKVAKEFSIGFAPDGWQNLESAFKQYDDPSLEKAGLIQKNDKGKYYDRFRNRIMFPIINEKGQVIAFGGRVINPEDTPKYYNSPETPLFQKSYELYGLIHARKPIREKGYVVVVEGYMDVVALAQHDFKNVVATLGTATTIYHIKKLMRYTQDIVFCFDGDNAGQTAAWRAMMNALSAVTDNVRLKFLFLPDNHDPDSYIREYSKDAFDQLAEDALPLSEYIVRHLTLTNDLSSQDKKVRLLNDVEPILNEMTAPKLHLFLRKKIAQLVGLDMQEITNILKDTKVAQPFSKRIKLEKRTQMNPIRRFILFIVIKPALANKDDLTLFSAKESEQILAKSVIEIALENKDNNAAVMLHLISNKIDKSILREMEDQIVKIDGDLPIEEEVKALRNSLQKKLLSSANKTKLGELQQKSLGSLTDEEKTFLKNIRRK
ncbi:MAG: DNA primase [Methylophilales bacterium BACL14 MAG-120910-bin43]|jgi:DNA primase|nr:MAG: DNA primase [Methylophilales bacterium BACL14 MAG-120910-bin43]KRP07463.1 MAG: DNA primase [Methylophilales bacterium BACL14 MAG-120920-bin58]